jgi:flavin-binding protein dodecin
MNFMPGVKVIEVIASSDKGIAVAIQNVVAEVTRAFHTNNAVFAKDIKVGLIESQISNSVLFCKFSFRLDEDTTEK